MPNANANCKGWTGQVDPHGNEVIGIPTITAIYWSQGFVESPGLANMMDRFFNRLVSGSYFTGLTQYNVNAPEFSGSFVMDPQVQGNIPQASPLDDGTIQSQLQQWFSNGAIPGPNQQDFDSLYVLIAPAGLEVTYDGLTSLNDFAGYHSSVAMGWGNLGKASLFYCVVPWPRVSPSVPDDLAAWFDEMTVNVTHEIVESSTNRTGNGWYVDSGAARKCEVCDVCQDPGSIVLDGYAVSPYWSNEDGTCIPTQDSLGFAIGLENSLNPTVVNLPADLTQGIADFIGRGNVLGDISFAPDGTWVILGDTRRVSEFLPSNGFPVDVLAEMAAFKSNGLEIWNVRFAANGGWIIVARGNGYYGGGFPSDAWDAVGAMIQQGEELWDVIFGPDGSWMIQGANNFREYGDGFPVPARDAFEQMLAIESGMVADGLRFLPNGNAIAWGHSQDDMSWYQISEQLPQPLDNAINSMTSKVDCIVISPMSSSGIAR